MFFYHLENVTQTAMVDMLPCRKHQRSRVVVKAGFFYPCVTADTTLGARYKCTITSMKLFLGARGKV